MTVNDRLVGMFDMLTKVPKDKLLHSFYGSLVYTLFAFIDPTFAIAVTYVVAVSREVWNETGVSFTDIVATVGIATLIYIGAII